MTWPPPLDLILDERARQRAKWSGHHPWGEGDCSSLHVDMAVKLAVLGEEVGEVNRAYLERDTDGLRDELVQVAAVAVAILEGIQEYGREITRPRLPRGMS